MRCLAHEEQLLVEMLGRLANGKLGRRGSADEAARLSAANLALAEHAHLELELAELERRVRNRFVRILRGETAYAKRQQPFPSGELVDQVAAAGANPEHTAAVREAVVVTLARIRTTLRVVERDVLAPLRRLKPRDASLVLEALEATDTLRADVGSVDSDRVSVPQRTARHRQARARRAAQEASLQWLKS